MLKQPNVTTYPFLALLFTVIQGILIFLKVFELVKWSWTLVLLPLWIYLAVFVVALFVGLFYLLFGCRR